MADDRNFTFPLYLTDFEASEKFAERIARKLNPGDVIGLSGYLGIGKTAIARSIIKTLMTTYNLPQCEIPSPTFTLVEQYDLPPFSIFHIDLYRINDVEDIFELGIEEIFNFGVSLIEWPDRLGKLRPHNMLDLRLFPGEDEKSRVIQVENSGSWSRQDLDSILNG